MRARIQTEPADCILSQMPDFSATRPAYPLYPFMVTKEYAGMSASETSANTSRRPRWAQSCHSWSLEPRFAVGTLISGRAPHRSVRARFTHTAPTLGDGRPAAD